MKSPYEKALTTVLTLLVVVISFGSFMGCSAPEEEEPPNKPNKKDSGNYVYKGVLEEIDGDTYKVPWFVLKFKGGGQAQIRMPYLADLYIGHYQEITVDKEGNFLFNHCETYNQLCENYEKQPYQELVAEKTEESEPEPEMVASNDGC